MIHIWRTLVKLLALAIIHTNVGEAHPRESCPEEKQARLINSLSEYDVTFPVEVGHSGEFVDHVMTLSAHRRRRRSLNEENGPIMYQVVFQNRTFKMRLRLNDKLLGSNFVVERFKEDGSVERNHTTENCYLIGETEDAHFNVAITDCDGLAGIIDLGRDAIFIEPLLNESLVAERGWNRPGRRAHLVYRSSTLHRGAHQVPWPLAAHDILPDELREDKIDVEFRHKAATRSYITFVNNARRLVKIYYLEGRTEKFFQMLSPGKETSVNTYVSHRWLVKDRDTNTRLLLDNVRLLTPPTGYSVDRRRCVSITVPANVRLPSPRPTLKPNAFVVFVNKLDRFVKLYYKEDGENRLFSSLYPEGEVSVNTFAGHEWIAVDYDTSESLYVDRRYRFKAVKNSGRSRTRVYVTKPPGVTLPVTSYPEPLQTPPRYVEVMATADTSVVKFHGKDRVEKYVLTLMNIVSRLFQHKSIGVPIYFVVVRLVLLEKDPEEIKIGGHPMKSLNSVCLWGNRMRRGSDKNTKNYHDQTVFLTRKEFGPSGYAPVHAMCYRSRSCTLNDDDGFTSSFIIAHETGHTMGMEHDGEGNTCASDVIKGSIMAPLVRSRFDRFYWSACSRRELIRSLRSLWCLKDAPFRNQLPHLKKLPGEIFTVDDQCKQMFGSVSRFCTAAVRDRCKELWCTRQGSQTTRYCHTRRVAALEGTECGRGKWCRLGKCVSKATNPAVTVPNPRPTEKPVHGGWGEWSASTECSRSCGTGIKSEARRCDNPTPSFWGNPCEGNATSYELCNVEPCPGKLRTYQQIRDAQCQQLSTTNSPGSGAGWALYDLENPRASCDFESGLCGWRQDESADFEWIRHSGPTRTGGTGPAHDHTKRPGKEGSYVHIEASRPAKKGFRARLVSRVISLKVSCLRFFYHMHGNNAHIGELSMRVKTLAPGAEDKAVWALDEKQGEDWVSKSIMLVSTVPFLIIFQATRGDGYLGDIALDDITLDPGSCRERPRPIRKQDIMQLKPCIALCEPRQGADTQHTVQLVSLENGTRCHDDPSVFDSCVHGRCLPMGCDGVAGSTERLDSCAVCGGRNDTCERKADTLRVTPDQHDQLLFSCPVGSTSIKIEKRNDGSNFLVPVSTASEHAYLNGEGYPLDTGAYYLAGAIFTYTRTDNLEILRGLGPTKERFDVKLQSVGDPSESVLQYEMFVNLSSSQNYFWRPGAWSQCSQTCGQDGFMTRGFKCYREIDGEHVESILCKATEKRANTTRSCNRLPCERYSWNTSDWSACSTSCGPGSQTRETSCVKIPGGKPADPQNCTDRRPEVMQKCMARPCYTWNSTDWSECSRACGGGWQRRRSVCINTSTRETVSSYHCGNGRPQGGRKCNQHSCFAWKTTKFAACSRTCGGGLQHRRVECKSYAHGEPTSVSSSYCRGRRPPRTRECNLAPCFSWNLTAWSPCSSQCGPGTQTRRVRCIDLYYAMAVVWTACGRPRPPSSQPCIQRDCNTWVTSNWTTCPVQCGGGVQTREVSCRKASNGQVLAALHCSSDTPPKRRRCNTQSCYYWDISDWSNCSTPCDGGLQTRQADCRSNATHNAVYSGYCAGKRPADIKRCNTDPCPAEWVTGNWSQCSRSCGNGVRTRLVTCVNVLKKRSDVCDVNDKPRTSTRCDMEPCPTQRTSVFEELSCTFEEGFCQWTHSQDVFGQFNWQRWNGSTPSRSTGPTHDHTLRTPEGHYLYIEASKPQASGDRARLISPRIEAERVCLDFWYHMYGRNVGVLKVYLVPEPGRRGERLWFKFGERGTKWHNAQLSISSGKPFQLLFEGVRGKGFSGDLAIDDVRAYAGRCHDGPVAEDTSCIADTSSYCSAAVRLGWCSSQRWRRMCCLSCPKDIRAGAGT